QIGTTKGSAGVRWPLRNIPGTDTLPDGYYSAWYYIPTKFTCSWCNAMQWKTVWTSGESSNPTTSVNIWTDKTGMHLDAVNYLDNGAPYDSSNAHEIALPEDVLPTGQWFQIESYYVWSQQNAGELTTWLNGKQIWSVKNLRTQEITPPWTQPMQWSCNLYG